MIKTKRLLTVLSVLTLLFIWGNSALPAAASTVLSDWVRGLLPSFGGGGGGASSYFVRKLAHFSEFAALGALLTWLSLIGRPGEKPSVHRIALCGILTALIDESIQMLGDRSSQVKDVWIDFSGFMVGFLAAWAIVAAVTRRREKKRRAVK